MAAAAIAVGASVVSGVLGFGASKSAKRAAQRAAREQARINKELTAERLEQLRADERTLAGQTRANAAASGTVITSGSVLQILAEQAREFERERKITKKVGASNVAAALAQGRAVGKQAEAQGLASLFSGIGNAAMIGYNAGLFTKVPGG